MYLWIIKEILNIDLIIAEKISLSLDNSGGVNVGDEEGAIVVLIWKEIMEIQRRIRYLRKTFNQCQQEKRFP